ncbi:E3 ubiquitin-protein ligase listerin [Pseudolycoriella hygida]|uniref:E3 ubiquitin-protein ligase listerin n=1 Tax=Pseudolycoriella hygida TaxID=35572 RepID=A0A9Q0N613_9DIPT|nr:E3 ubiquitin-protein ligase listerin [Pseudolycoriella hygida]
MGGKTKQTQRTKNNSKPSNSGRSAELLGASVQPFVGFASTLSDGGYLSVLPGFQSSDASPEEIDSNVDYNFQLVFRKMTKKDPTTKVKALQEFTELVGQSDVDAVKAILPFWPRLYATLAVDVEHRVREFSQQAQAALVNKCGKHIAPQLKQLAPIWITSQYDFYAPAASIASTSFKSAFPPVKLQEVFNFCQSEVLEYIVKNVTVFTATTLSNPKVFSTEECELKYQRVVACSLQGYALYLSKVSEDQLKEAIEKNAALVDNPKFWSFHKHKVASVRAAWYEVLSSLLQHGLFLLDNHRPQATVCAIQAIDESESSALPFVWESILLVTQKIDDWNKHVNMEKALLPKLAKVLKTGGNGNAAVIFPHLLPFLAKFNASVLNDGLHTFYKEFFRNIKTGLQTRSSRSDTTAISTAYFECLQFTFTQLNVDDFPTESEFVDYCTELVDENVIDVLEWCVTKVFCNAKYVFASLAALLAAWCNQEKKLYATALSNIWQRLYAILETSLDGDVDFDSILESHYDLVQSFRNANSIKAKNVRVKFASDEDQVDAVVKTTNKLPHFDELIYRLCNLYIKKTTATNSPQCLGNLENLLKQFASAELFMKLSDGKGYFKLYDTYTMWLFLTNLRKECVVDIILLMYSFMSAEEKVELLNKLIKFNNEQVQTWFLARLLSHPLVMEANVTQLIRQESVTKILLKCARAVLDGDTKENINFLHKCFFQNENGEILIDNATCSGIVHVLAEALQDTLRADVLDICTSFLAQIMPVVCCDPAKKDLQHFLFLQFFAFSSLKNVDDDLSEDTMWEVTSSWQDALSSNDLQLNQDLLNECLPIIDSCLFQSEEPALKIIENLAEMVSKLILCSIECIDNESDKYKRADEIIDTIFNQRVKNDKIDLSLVESFCGFVESINETLTVPTVGTDIEHQYPTHLEIMMSQFFKWWYFKFSVVFKITCRIRQCRETETGEGSGDDEYTEDFCDLDENLIKNWSENIFDEILHSIYVAALSNTLINHSIVLKEYTQSLLLNLSESVVLYLKNISSKNFQDVRDRLVFNAATKGYFWCMSALVLIKTEQNGEPENGAELLMMYERVTSTKCCWDLPQTNMYQVVSQVGPRQLPQPKVLDDNLLYKLVQLRCIIKNYFSVTNYNETNDRNFVDQTLKLIGDLRTKSKTDKEFLLYNEDISRRDSSEIILATEIVNFLNQAILIFPRQLDTESWDFIRIALSSWVLSISKTTKHYRLTKVAIFISAVYRLFRNLSKFLALEKTKSSTEMFTNVVDEWENVFAKNVNLLLLKCYMKFINNKENNLKDLTFIESLSPAIGTINFAYVIAANKIDSEASLDDLVNFALKYISHPHHTIRASCAQILKRLAKGLVARDVDQLNKRNELEMQGKGNKLVGEWHLLHKFAKHIQVRNGLMQLFEFSFKTNDLDDLDDVPIDMSIPFLLLWDCILDICSKSSSELRSTYAAYITESKFVQSMLNSLFRLMPVEILKNQDIQQIGSMYFTPLSWEEICDVDITPERYSCYIYSQTLRHLPAVARKWWHDSNARQKNLVDKITTCFVSPLICQEELRSLVEKREKYENMQITVHQSTREVLASYSIDDARIECTITLPVNHPLGVVKVGSDKQIGSRLQSRVLVMQLTIFLSHQNGSIWDALVLWRRNLDRKFEGVEECYVCYSVIHQDTCQLPKLTCKTCKKKFHGTCLYKWFSTSSKSTCPICRNIF